MGEWYQTEDRDPVREYVVEAFKDLLDTALKAAFPSRNAAASRDTSIDPQDLQPNQTPWTYVESTTENKEDRDGLTSARLRLRTWTWVFNEDPGEVDPAMNAVNRVIYRAIAPGLTIVNVPGYGKVSCAVLTPDADETFSGEKDGLLVFPFVVHYSFATANP